MSPDRITILKLKVGLSARTTVSFFRRELGYALAVPIVASLYFELMFWLSNLSVLRSIMGSAKVSLLEKLNVLASPLTAIHQSSGLVSLILMVAVAVTQAIVIVLLVYVVKHRQSPTGEEVGRSLFASTLAVIGLGCPACGTSLITPIISLFATSSAVTIADQITLIALPLALVVSIYGLYDLGLKTANVKAQLAFDRLPVTPQSL